MNWDLHGVTVQAEVADDFLRQLCMEGMELVPRATAGERGRTCEFRAAIDAQVPDRASWALADRLCLSKGKVVLPLEIRTASKPERLTVDYASRASAQIDYEDCRIELTVHDLGYFQAHYDPLYSSSVLFKSLLLEVLPEYGVYPLHAGMCELGDAGLIVCGEPGVGKTLLILLLSQRGFGYMSDELGFLRRAVDGSVESLAFPIRGRLRLPNGLGPASPVLPGPAIVARTDDGQAVFSPALLSARGMSRTVPRILINVAGTSEGPSQLTPSDDLAAMQALTLYDVYYGDRHARSQFAICADLADQVQAFDVVVGSDHDSLARRVERLITDG